jgi:two-component system nitrate/nitrite response regulator NarL
MTQPASEARPRVRVLLVDDEPDMRELERLSLAHDARFVVVGEAGDGSEAVTAASRTQPDVVLLDLAMPTMGGMEALPLICKAAPDSQVVMLSALPAERYAPEALSLGAAAYLDKRSVPELAEILGRLCDAGRG